MRNIRLSGREIAVVRAMGFSLPTSGTELQERTNLAAEDLTDVLNGLMSTGFVESVPYQDQIAEADIATHEFEVNGSFVNELKAALGMRR